MKFDIIVCTDQNGGIGKEGKIPWHLPEDIKRFKELTLNSTVIMGRKTWDSIPFKFKPLPDRDNFILTRKILPVNEFSNNGRVKYFTNFDDALENVKTDKIFVIGGSFIYDQALKHPKVRIVYLTRINKYFNCDVNFFLEEKDFDILEKSDMMKENGLEFNYINYIRKNNQEVNYLNLMKKIYVEGVVKNDRTGVGIHSLFSEKLEFDLRAGFPLMTTKKTFFRGVAEELLFFISGKTDTKILSEKGVKIWEPNTTREFLDGRGLNYEEGFMGPMYSWQWRHAGLEYTGKDVELGEGGIDQLQNAIDLIKNDPTSRRIIINSHDTVNLDKGVLLCCHTMFQFWVDTERGELSCQMYQRSADMFLGVPFNIASYALLTEMMAHICGLKARKLSVVFGDCHLYRNHIDQYKEQISRIPYLFPELKICRKVENINDFKFEDFQLSNYICHSSIKAPMAC